MKALIALTLLSAGTAFADETVDYGPASTCPTYCTGFETDSDQYMLDWLNAVYANTAYPRTVLSVNSTVYSGDTVATLIGTVAGHSFYQCDGTLQAADGSAMTVSYELEYWTTRTVSGRVAGHTVPHRMVDGGTMTLP